MARYIDADERLNSLPNDLPYKASVKRVLMQAPDADVVPKSEVEKLEEYIDDLNDSKEHLCVMLEEAKQEADLLEQEKDALIKNYSTCMKDYAREIFEEIEKHRDNIHGVVLLLPEELAELKKKYTEDKQ